MIVVVLLIAGYISIFAIMKWIKWHYENDANRIRFHKYTEKEKKSDHCIDKLRFEVSLKDGGTTNDIYGNAPGAKGKHLK